jgi:diguanylate cyclase (GGDEF)-like protein
MLPGMSDARGTTAHTSPDLGARPGLRALNSPPMVAFACSAGVAAVALLDLGAGAGVTLAPLHVVPVGAAAWASRTWASVLATAAAAATMTVLLLEATALLAAAASAAVLLIVLAAVMLGVQALRRLVFDEHRASVVDSLTGALNRRGFEMVAERELARSARERNELSIAYFDLDGFKRINDERGHAAGDAVLTTFADAVKVSVRATDVFARFGGDEFVLLLPDTDARQALIVVDRIRRILAETATDLGRLTASIGVATYRRPPESVDALVFGVDHLMYEAKERGGDAVVGQMVVGTPGRWDEITIGDEPPHPTTTSA